MSYQIKQGSPFGRIGTELGKGLSEQIPKEAERSRLSSGLKALGEKKGLTPFQQFSELLSIPGMTPQGIQSGAELLKTQTQKQGYSNRERNGQEPQTQKDNLNKVDFANLNQRRSPIQGENQREQVPQGNYPEGTPQIVPENPLAEKFQPAIPWSPEQRDSEIARVWDQHPQLTFPEVSQIVADNERRYLAAPEAYRAQQANLEKIQQEVNTETEKQLRKKLQIPKDKEIWDKISGESHNRIERGVEKDLRENPNASVKDLVNTWTDRALNNDKDKNEVRKIANRSFDEKIFKKSDNLDRLLSFSDSYKKFGNSEEYYKNLQTDFSLSPEGAASIAYKPSKSAMSYVNKIEESNPKNYYQNSIKHAANLRNYLTRDDSILTIAKNIKEKDPFFDVKAFLKEAKSNQKEILSPEQIRQLDESGSFDIFPNWGDMFLFPKFGRGK